MFHPINKFNVIQQNDSINVITQKDDNTTPKVTENVVIQTDNHMIQTDDHINVITQPD